MDQPKIERLLRLLKLLTSTADYTISDVALRLNTSERTIYRYLDTFKAAGFAVIKNGDYHRLSMESDYFKDISKIVHFTKEEGYIFNSLLDALNDDSELKTNLKKKLAAVYNSTNLAELVVKKDTAVLIGRITESMEKKCRICLKDYSSPQTSTLSDYVVEAFGYTGNYKQIWCFDPTDRKNKLFRTNRIGDVVLLDQPWENENEHKKGFVDIFRISGFKRKRVKLLLDSYAHEVLSNEFPMSHRYLKKQDEDTWILDTKVCSFEGAGRFYMGLADHIRIVESPDFQEYVNTFVKKFLL